MIKRSNNIIEFPVNRQSSADETREYEEASEIAEIISSKMIGDMARAGVKIKVSDENVLSSLVMLFETAHSLILKTKGLDHPLQSFSSKVYEMSEHDDFIEYDPAEIFSILAEDYIVANDENES